MGSVSAIPLYGWDKQHIIKHPLVPVGVVKWLASLSPPWSHIDLKSNTDLTIDCLVQSWTCIHNISVTLENPKTPLTIEFIKTDDKQHIGCRCVISPIKHRVIINGDALTDREQLMACRTLWVKTKSPTAHRTHGRLTIRSSQNCTIYFNPIKPLV